MDHHPLVHYNSGVGVVARFLPACFVKHYVPSFTKRNHNKNINFFLKLLY